MRAGQLTPLTVVAVVPVRHVAVGHAVHVTHVAGHLLNGRAGRVGGQQTGGQGVLVLLHQRLGLPPWSVRARERQKVEVSQS